MKIAIVSLLATTTLITLANAQPGSPLRGGTGCSVEGTDDGALITCQKANLQTTAEIFDGSNGQTGKKPMVSGSTGRSITHSADSLLLSLFLPVQVLQENRAVRLWLMVPPTKLQSPVATQLPSL